MAIIKGIEVTLQVFQGTEWVTCPESDTLDTLREGENSGTRQATVAECMPGFFRFKIVLIEGFEWGEANALRVNLTFDEGDMVHNYRVVVLRPGEATLAAALRVEEMASNGDGSVSYHLQEISAPLKPGQAHEPWYKARFEFEKRRVSTTNPGSQQRLCTTPHNTPTMSNIGPTTTTAKGRLRVDILPCVADRNPRKKALIPFIPGSSIMRSRRASSLDHTVTLKSSLNFDTSRESSDSYLFQCSTIDSIKQTSFTFLYREPEHYEKIPADEIEIVESRTLPSLVTSVNQERRRRSARTPQPRAGVSRLQKSVVPTSAPRSCPNARTKHDSTAWGDGNRLADAGQSLASTSVFGLQPTSDSDHNTQDTLMNDTNLVSLLEQALGNRQQRHQHHQRQQMQHEALKAETEEKWNKIRTDLETMASDKAEACNALQKAQNHLESLKSREISLRGQEKRIKDQLLELDQQLSLEKPEIDSSRLLGAASQAIQKLYEYEAAKSESRKRRRSEVSFSSSSVGKSPARRNVESEG